VGRLSELLQAAIDQAPVGVIVSDESGAEVYANAAARRFVEGRYAETIVHDAVETLRERARRDGEAEQVLDLYGPPRWNLLLHGWRLDRGAVVIIEDDTERRRLEEIRRDFVANVSHELKTPIGALGVLAETMEDEPDPELVKRLAARVHDEALRVGQLIDDLLELSRIEAEEGLAREPVSIAAVIDDAVDRVWPTARLADIDIKVLDQADGASVIGDRRQLLSAVANLVDNAVKYSDPGSQVEVRSRLDDGHVEIDVEDHGIGIPTRDLDRIFERFYRVDRARARTTGGTGLGLSIVRHVAHNHGGHVRVRSSEGDGSTFTLALPEGPR
jgi:two-component system sensor histidine kinase SenX3